MHRFAWHLLAFAGLLGLFFLVGCGEKETPKVAPSRTRANYDRDGFLTADAERPAAPPNLVILLIDTLRGDSLALPDDKFENHMPYLASLAKEGVSFRNAITSAPWTMPSLTSILTGLLPHEHGVDSLQYAQHLSGSVTTMAEALRNGYGYDTLGFAAGPWFDTRNTIWQGFQTQRSGFAMQGVKPILTDWVAKHDADQPFFLMLHSFEAHDPYGAANHPYPMPAVMLPPEGYDAWQVKDIKRQTFDFMTSRGKRMALERAWGTKYVRQVMRYIDSGYAEDPAPEMAVALRKRYFEGVRWVDGLVKKTVEHLREWKLLDDTLLIVMSDHGEAFAEHKTLDHGRVLYDELVRVPLVMVDFRKDKSKQVFRGGKVFTGPTAVFDAIPTFFEYAGLRPLTGIHAKSFLPKIRADDRTGGDPVFSEERLDRHNTMRNINVQMLSARSDRWKYIISYDQDKGTVSEELYDLTKDPGETDNLVVSPTSIAEINVGKTFCTAIEHVRNRIWGVVSAAVAHKGGPYSATESFLDPAKRPKGCGKANQ